MRPLRSCWPALLILVCSSPVALAEEVDAAQIYQQTVRATALIRGARSATGWLLDRERKLLVTSYYAVGKEKSVRVIFPEFKDGKLITERAHYDKNSRPITGQVLARTPERDLALIELESVPDGLKALKLAAEGPAPGQQLHLVANTDASKGIWSYSTGVVRQTARKREAFQGATLDVRVILCQVPINAGDSGGPVVNDAGELVGTAAGSVAGSRLVSFCIDVSEVREWIARSQPRQLDKGPKPAPEPSAPEANTPRKAQGAAAIAPRGTYKELLSAVVWVAPAGSKKGTGTGCLVSRKNKLVLTAYHLIGDDKTVSVWFPAYDSGKLVTQREHYGSKAMPITARVIRTEPSYGLALLELESLPEGAAEVKLATVSASPGERMFAMGNPRHSTGLWIFQTGAVRQIYARDARPESPWNARVLEIQTPFNPGDDGGPVVNSRGELIGIIEAAAAKAPYVTGCLDVTEISDLLKKLTKD